MFGQVFLAQESIAASRADKVLPNGFVDALHVTSKAVLRREVLVATVAMIGLLARAVDHDFVPTVIRNAREILFAFVASVQDSRIFVDCGLFMRRYQKRLTLCENDEESRNHQKYCHQQNRQHQTTTNHLMSLQVVIRLKVFVTDLANESLRPLRVNSGQIRFRFYQRHRISGGNIFRRVRGNCQGADRRWRFVRLGTGTRVSRHRHCLAVVRYFSFNVAR